MGLKIAISCGEVSGDRHLAPVLQAIRLRLPDATIRGMAGTACEAAGAELLVNCYQQGAAMGFLELLRPLKGIIDSFRRMKRFLEEWRPALLIVVDYPDFNLRLAKVAKGLGIKVLYFIPPKVWAWRSGRVRKIQNFVDCVAAIFPFEPDFYRKHGYENVVYVGHPVSTIVTSNLPHDQRAPYRLVILTGSRSFEVDRLFKPILKSFELMVSQVPDLSAEVVVAPNVSPEKLQDVAREQLAPHLYDRLRWNTTDSIQAMSRAAVGILKSGTCNLEAACTGTPFVCVYSGTLMAKVIVSLLVPFKQYSPVNIIRPSTVSELIHVHLDPVELSQKVIRLLNDRASWDETHKHLGEVHEMLARGADSTQAESVFERVAGLAIQVAQ